jgi:hypothetical protein
VQNGASVAFDKVPNIMTEKITAELEEITYMTDPGQWLASMAVTRTVSSPSKGKIVGVSRGSTRCRGVSKSSQATSILYILEGPFQYSAPCHY